MNVLAPQEDKDLLAKLAELEAFLDGSGPLETSYFGEMHAFGTRGRYWWRKPMHEVFARLRSRLKQPDWVAWKSIDTVPKDGTRVLLYSPDACEQERVFAARFLYPEDDVLRGWWESLDTDEPIDVEPTKWLPLPPEPYRGEK